MKEPLLFHPGFYGGERGSKGGMCGVGRMDWEVGGECPIYFTRGSMEGKGGGGMCGVGRMDWEGGGGRGASIKLIPDGDTEKLVVRRTS